MWDADGRASVRVEEGAERSGGGLAYNADKASGIDVDGERDFAEDHQGPKTILNMIKVDTEGFSMLAVQEDESKVMVIAGLSDSSVAVIDMTREVILHVYKGHTVLYICIYTYIHIYVCIYIYIGDFARVQRSHGPRARSPLLIRKRAASNRGLGPEHPRVAIAGKRDFSHQKRPNTLVKET